MELLKEGDIVTSINYETVFNASQSYYINLTVARKTEVKGTSLLDSLTAIAKEFEVNTIVKERVSFSVITLDSTIRAVLYYQDKLILVFLYGELELPKKNLRIQPKKQKYQFRGFTYE